MSNNTAPTTNAAGAEALWNGRQREYYALLLHRAKQGVLEPDEMIVLSMFDEVLPQLDALTAERDEAIERGEAQRQRADRLHDAIGVDVVLDLTRQLQGCLNPSDQQLRILCNVLDDRLENYKHHAEYAEGAATALKYERLAKDCDDLLTLIAATQSARRELNRMDSSARDATTQPQKETSNE